MTCLAVSPDGLLIATGEISRRPSILIWQADTGDVVQVSPDIQNPFWRPTKMFWYPLSPVAALRFVVSVLSSYLAGVIIACLDEDFLAPLRS